MLRCREASIPQTHKMRPSERVNVHPPTRQPSDLKETTYDVICIGSGWAARVAAERLQKAGFSTIIVEEELVGGECPFWACVPSKVLLRPAEALKDARASGLQVPDLDAKEVFKRRDGFTADWDDSKALIPLVETTGAKLVRGVGKIVGEKKVAVGDIELQARHAVVIDSGSLPIMPGIPGLKEANPWTPRDATSSNLVPDRLVIMGAGAVGCEMATAYQSLGSKITLVSSSSEILPSVDPDAGKIVREALEARGARVLASTRVNAVRDGMIELSNGEKVQGEILVAAGRKPKFDRPLKVNDSLRENEWLYAGGDVTKHAMLTHSSKYHGRVIAATIISKANGVDAGEPFTRTAATADRFAVPQVTFTDPPVATVGLTRTAAERAGKTFTEVTAPFATTSTRIRGDVAEGWAQWIVQDNKLVGATFVGSGAADTLHASTVAIVGEVSLDRLAHAIPSFPTMSEVYLNLIQAAGY